MAVIPESSQGAGIWRTSMSSSPLSESSVCHSLSPSVTPQSAMATHTPLMHLSILAMMAITPPHILSTSRGKHVILLCSHGAKKAPLPPRDLYSSSTDRSAEPSPSFIYLSIPLPVLVLRHLSPVFTTCLYAH